MRKWTTTKKSETRYTNEAGFSLVEVLVAITILGLVIAGVTTAIISLNNATSRFQQTSVSQNDLTLAIDIINTDISSSTKIKSADKFRIDLETSANNVKNEVSIFAYVKGNSAYAAPTWANISSEVNSGILEVTRTAGSTGAGTVRILVPVFDPDRYGQGAALSGRSLFSYFNNENTKLSPTPIASTSLKSITRVEFFLAAIVNDGSLPVEMASSATPRSLNNAGTNSAGGSVPNKPNAPVLSGKISTDSALYPDINVRETTADLSWTIPAGATSYTLYVTGPNSTGGTERKVVKIIPDPSVHDFDHPGLIRGETYVYDIVASGPNGISAVSNTVSLTVKPDKVTIINMNTKKNLADVKANTQAESGTTNPYPGPYTVARNLTNQISWKPVNKAEGYRVFRNGQLIGTVSSSVTTYQDINATFVNYGSENTYRVAAYNTGQNGSGGQGELSDEKELISPPPAPPITATNNGGSASNTTNTVRVTTRDPNSIGHRIFASPSQGTDVNTKCNAVRSNTTPIYNSTGASVTQTVDWGSEWCYDALAYNDAGESPRRTATVANTIGAAPPGPFGNLNVWDAANRIQVDQQFALDIQQGASNEDIQSNWSASAGANNYRVELIAGDSGGKLLGGGNDFYTGNATSFWVGNKSPGTYYTVRITAVAPNGLTRQISTPFVTAPDVPIEAHSYIQTRSPYPFGRRMVAIIANTRYGMASISDAKTWIQGQAEPGFSGWGSDGGWKETVSGETNGGGTAGQVRTYINVYGFEKRSATLSWTGTISGGGCSSACGGGFANVAERAPDYYAGAHARYYARY